MTAAEALRTDITGLNVLVIGLPAAGKTFFAGWLGFYNPNHLLISTDDFLQGQNGVDAMYTALEKVTGVIATGQKTIVEGVAGYRMLRKGAQLDTYYPDIVFEVVATEQQRARIYVQQRTDRNFANVQKFDKALTTVRREYEAIIGDFEFPTWIEVSNIF